MTRTPIMPALAILLGVALTTTACQTGVTATSGAAQLTHRSSAAAPASSPPSPAAVADGGDFCQLVTVTRNLLVNPDAADLATDPGKAQQSWQQVLAAAPEEIKPDIQAIMDVEMPVLRGEVPADQIDQRLQDPKLAPAMQHYAEYIQAHCGDAGLPTG